MAVIYSVANGGFVQVPSGSAKYLFELSGELDIPAGIALPYQHVKSAFTISSATSIFTSAGTATYTLTVTSTASDGTDLVTHINSQTLTPESGESLTSTIAQASVGANRILKVSLVRNSGTPSTDFTITLE